MFLGLFSVADTAIRVVFKPQWLSLILPLKILCLAACFRAISVLNAPLLLAKGMPEIVTRNSFLQAVVLPLAFLIGARYGLTGVAMAWLVTMPVLLAIMTWQTLRVTGLTVRAFLAELTPYIIGASIMTAGVMLVLATLGRPTVPGLVLLCAIGAGLYLGYTFLFNRRAINEAIGLVRGR
jgi:O-antigen/teichoic acid export membrane protein